MRQPAESNRRQSSATNKFELRYYEVLRMVLYFAFLQGLFQERFYTGVLRLSLTSLLVVSAK